MTTDPLAFGDAKVFVITGLNPVPWKTTSTVKDGNLENYQNSLRVELESKYSEEARRPPGGMLSVRFVFKRSTKGGRRADSSNLTKATEDAIQGVLTGNDKYNAEVSGELIEQGPDVEPLVAILISPWRKSGLADFAERHALDEEEPAESAIELQVQSYGF